MIADPVAFAEQWCEAWNAHDLDALLEHFHDDVVFTSPVARTVFPESGGTCTGMVALRDYWTRGLELVPDLHFTVEEVFAGISAVVIRYRNQRGQRVCEVLVFEGELVREGHGTYLVEDRPA
ncbi:nuclear transport factor 2 family protein [Microlunatus flavus]|uniref:SnoaL-like domain-containing protein n=1 Tax=Microlunatus flavus TaxID=1036181 RepID=A0A1H9JKC0_9ACTN|nr:nuclear transport factor 2 family protein [Microlunatus flavus]SEQ87260.1 SnoaL-like domain-containing protein [Microlunatus flavus]